MLLFPVGAFVTYNDISLSLITPLNTIVSMFPYITLVSISFFFSKKYGWSTKDNQNNSVHSLAVTVKKYIFFKILV